MCKNHYHLLSFYQSIGGNFRKVSNFSLAEKAKVKEKEKTSFFSVAAQQRAQHRSSESTGVEHFLLKLKNYYKLKLRERKKSTKRANI